MASLLPPFVRQFGPGAKGPDVLAVKRALKAAGYGKGIALTQTFGKAAQADLAAFKTKHRLLSDPVYTPQAQAALARWFDAKGVELLEQELDLQRRTAFLSVAAWTVAHHGIFRYTEQADLRMSMLTLAPFQTAHTVYADCSGHAIGCGHWAKLPAALFNAPGFTGTILDACKHIAATQARAGDLAVYVTPSAPAGVHVTILYQRQGSGWRVVNHGAPGQPIFDTLANENAAHPAATVVYCQLPTR